MKSGKNFYPENLGKLLKNFEQESDMIRTAFKEYHSGGNRDSTEGRFAFHPSHVQACSQKSCSY